MSISEGDIVICSAGALRVKTVMHVSVLNPVVNVNSDSLNRLKYINQRILQEANLSMIQRIGMPLIAAGITFAGTSTHVFGFPTRLDSNQSPSL